MPISEYEEGMLARPSRHPCEAIAPAPNRPSLHLRDAPLIVDLDGGEGCEASGGEQVEGRWER